MRLAFHAAAGDVPGFCALVEAVGALFQVDCGMLGGGPAAWQKNRRARDFGFDARRLGFVLPPHAAIEEKDAEWPLRHRCRCRICHATANECVSL